MYRPLVFNRRKKEEDPMVISWIIPALVMVVGALAYALSANPKASELGRIAFFVGLFVLTWGLGGTTLRL